MHDLEKALYERFSAGLTRKTISDCAKYALKYRVMGKPFPGPWSFAHHPWSYGMHTCTDELMVGQKAAQMAFTETALNIVFYAIDILGESVIYFLPATKPDAKDFSMARFDPALELSPHLNSLFDDVDNTFHKRAGTANLYVRGSRSRNAAKSVPAAKLIFDELEEMVQSNVTLALERTSGQLEKQVFMLSTPSAHDHGINKYYRKTDQRHYFFVCPHCSKLTELIYPDCLVITSDDPDDPAILDSHLICKECKQVLKHETKIDWLAAKELGGKAIWVPQFAGRLSTGFHVSQLYSMTVKPYQIAQFVLNAEGSPAVEQELHNSKLGMPHVTKGAQVTAEHIQGCTSCFSQVENNDGYQMVTMGVDVGKVFHVEICGWVPRADTKGSDPTDMVVPRVLKEITVKDRADLEDLMVRYSVDMCVIDAHPERRTALDFARRFIPRVRMCIYSAGVMGRILKVRDEEGEPIVSVDRTAWLDRSLGRFISNRIELPEELSAQYKKQVCTPAKIYKKDRDGNPVARYVSDDKDDHFAHARNYSEIALALALNVSVVEDIRSNNESH